MRKTIPLREWQFEMDGAAPETVTLPHTWNALDGQDGGDDYRRGEAFYTCEFPLEAGSKGKVYAVFEGANHTAQVWCNGVAAGGHRGGFSRFFIDITGLVQGGINTLRVSVDNSACAPVYPQQADFTFFGGLYRPVSLLLLDEVHLTPGRFGGDGVRVDAAPGGSVTVTANPSGRGALRATVLDGAGTAVCETTCEASGGPVALALQVEAPRLWDGLRDPYLYTCVLRLESGGVVRDELIIPFGFRSFGVDKHTGFHLNGKPTPLRGVAMHQDRQDMGWATGPTQREEDLALVREIGANTLRLAHYQHAGHTYGLCDRQGLVVWAEIPFISAFNPAPEAAENTKTQLAELIEQNYNHPSICFWGLANELGIGGESEALLENLRELNALAHEMDKTRPTAIANLGTTATDSGQCAITDLLGFNNYLGWYEGEAGDIGPYLDGLQAGFAKPVALTEYGAEALTAWHSEAPKKQDYSEEYQALVHEAAQKALAERPWVWGAWVWNMFDFAADRRDEGGCKGRNNKGLVTYDRKTKKDAFYLYKAHWSSEPFVYIAGRRFRQRVAATVALKVYSNCGSVTLCVNDGPAITQQGGRVFVFENVRLRPGVNRVVATAGGCGDSIELVQTDSPTESYVVPAAEKHINEDVAQWFAAFEPASQELVARAGYLSVEDTMDTILAYPEGAEALRKFLLDPLAKATGAPSGSGGGGGPMKVSSIWRHMQTMLPDNAILLLNEALCQIPKEAPHESIGL